jgi:hypothetical protein
MDSGVARRLRTSIRKNRPPRPSVIIMRGTFFYILIPLVFFNNFSDFLEVHSLPPVTKSCYTLGHGFGPTGLIMDLYLVLN